MSAVIKPEWISYSQYVEQERIAPTKSEYYAGEMFAMAGGSQRHNAISGNTFATLYAQLATQPCRPSLSDQRIRISKLELGTYPDVSVVCGKPTSDPIDPDAITNPKVLVEVLSKTTESYDRGKKFSFYRQIDSLDEYVLISQDEPLVERFKRQPSGEWLLTVFKGIDSILDLPSIETSLALSDIYRTVDWTEGEAPT